VDARADELTGLAELVFRAAAVLVSEFERASDSLGVTKQQMVVLRAVPSAGTVAELAAICRIDPSNLATVLARLEERGLAQRRPSEVDRRTKVVGLTAAGRRAVSGFERQITAATVLTSRLDDADRDALAALLRRLVA
jgi:DNA-binding MarR family transcriptional regulator